jgi:hypothetical protein
VGELGRKEFENFRRNPPGTELPGCDHATGDTAGSNADRPDILRQIPRKWAKAASATRSQIDHASGLDLPGQRRKNILVFSLINLLRPRKS